VIIEAILELIFGLIEGILDLFPGDPGFQIYALPPGFAAPASIIAAVFPFDVALAMAFTLTIWSIVCHGYRLVLWLLGVFHVSGDSV
jgi:hypothetical protein